MPRDKSASRDKRYGLARWRRVALRVKNRDGWRCWVPNCMRTGTAADHIEPTTPDTPDSLFFAESNLRASCAHHNLRRGHALQLEREIAGQSEPSERPRLRPISFGEVPIGRRPKPRVY